jgi:hypothetical protein
VEFFACFREENRRAAAGGRPAGAYILHVRMTQLSVCCVMYRLVSDGRGPVAGAAGQRKGA